MEAENGGGKRSLEEDGLERKKRRALEAVFGELSDGDGDNDTHLLSCSSSAASAVCHGQGKARWERVEGIRGLWLCREFLPPDRQLGLLSAIEKEGWFIEKTHNQAMRFGDLPHWATELSNLIHDVACVEDSDSVMFDESVTDDHNIYPMPEYLLRREPLFDQLIVNIYEPGEGICAHVDLMRFEDGIAVVSLESECVMRFTPVETRLSDALVGDGQLKFPSTGIPVLLTPGSLIILSGEARYLWKHEINRKPGLQVWSGEELLQRKRTSVTLRKLCPSD